MSDCNSSGNSTRLRRKIVQDELESDRKQKNISIKKVSVILKKREEERTDEENEFLFKSAELAKEAASRLEKRELIKQREKEFEDSDESLDEKCAKLAEALGAAKYLVVYTGAGISTAAQIPDYRGTSGIWTLLQQGKDIGEHDLTQAEPTYTHMALSEMYHRGRLKHIVSQNCDGLHLRSGLPKTALSELHGNMYIEVCRTCRPFREYLRLFDVTESTARFNHRTHRLCYRCQSPLADSIVHFGERGNLPWPLNWKGACRAAEKADVILCMGSSLKVLKRYPWLWCMDKPVKRRPKLFIVNLQWTPKDCHAVLKIHGKCDAVMKRVMKFLGVQVPIYKKEQDPIFGHATPLCSDENHTTTRSPLQSPPEAAAEELIVITVESDPPACCDTFKSNSDHDRACTNFVEQDRDVPIIMAPDPQAPISSLMEVMFFNYLYTLISSFTPYQFHTPPIIPALPSTSSNYQDDDDVPVEKRPKLATNTVKCSFCTKHYRAEQCLFYMRYEGKFEGNVRTCLCCGSDESESEDKIENGDKPKKEEGDSDKAEKESIDKQKTGTNTGWYGRGYRKRMKKKR